MKLTIITALYNTPEEKFKRMVTSIEKANKICQINYQHIVVDDGSNTNVKKYLKNYKKKCKVLTLNKNMGQSYARNLGINYVKNSDDGYILFLDSDD